MKFFDALGDLISAQAKYVEALSVSKQEELMKEAYDAGHTDGQREMNNSAWDASSLRAQLRVSEQEAAKHRNASVTLNNILWEMGKWLGVRQRMEIEGYSVIDADPLRLTEETGRLVRWRQSQIERIRAVYETDRDWDKASAVINEEFNAEVT